MRLSHRNQSIANRFCIGLTGAAAAAGYAGWRGMLAWIAFDAIALRLMRSRLDIAPASPQRLLPAFERYEAGQLSDNASDSNA